MFFQALQTYYAPGTTLLIFAVFILLDKIFPQSVKRLFLLEIGIIFLLIVDTWIDSIFGTKVVGDWWKFRTFTTFINFALSPCSPMVLVLIYKTGVTNKWNKLFFIPQLVNLFFCILSIYTGCIFHVDTKNTYTRGPLFFIPFAVSALYMISLILFSEKQKSKPNRHAETIFILVIMAVIALASVLEIFVSMRFLIWSTTEICAILYFLLLSIQKILYDPLTGSLSRLSYEKQLEKIDGRTACTIAMIDLNNLKQINDKLGHSAGDAAIHGVSTAILKTKSRHMKLYRYGGDEFILLSCKLCRDDMNDALFHAQRNCTTSNIPISLSFAYGIAEYLPGNDLFQTIKKADIAMYQSKRNIFV